MESLKELKEYRAEVIGKLHEMKDSLGEGNVFNDEQLVEWDALDTELKTTNEKIETQERLLNVPSFTEEKEEQPQRIKPIAFSKRNVDNAEVFRAWCLTQTNNREHITPRMQEMAHRSGINLDRPLTGAVRWDQTVGTDGQGGFAVNDEVVSGIVHKLKDYGGMLSTCHVFNTADASPLRKVVHDATSFTATKTAELGTIANTAQTLTKVSFGATKYTSGIYEISNELLRDSSYNLIGEFQTAIADSFGRAFNAVLTTGSLADEPAGVEGAATATADSTLTHDTLLNLIHSIDPAYRRSPKFALMMNDDSLLALKKTLVDADGRPLYNTSPNSNVVVPMAMQIDGVPVVVNSDVSANTIVCGDFSRYHIRMVGSMSIKVLNELYALTDAIALVGIHTIDGRSVDDSAFAKLVWV